MNSPESGSTTRLTSLVGSSRGRANDQAWPASAAVPASAPPRPTMQVRAPDTRAPPGSRRTADTTRASAPAPTTSSRPAPTSLIRGSPAAQRPQGGDDDLGLGSTTGDRHVDRHEVRDRSLHPVGAREQAAVMSAVTQCHDTLG